MMCSSCGLNKAVAPKNSKLMPGTRLFLCEECIGMEPRYLVVIYGRQRFTKGAAGNDLLIDFIKKRKYRGPEILATELV